MIVKCFLTISVLMISCNEKKDSIYTKLHANIYEINNQYFYGENVRTYLIELDDKVLMFDIPTYSEELEAFILSFDKPAYAVISHGSCGIKDGTIWQKEINLKVYAHEEDRNHPWLRMEPDVFFTELPEFDESIIVIHTPGHSAGSICVLETNSKSLFVGDTFYADKEGKVKDFTRESQSDYENLENRIISCRDLLNYDFENVYPFHYEKILNSGKDLLEEYLLDK